MQTISVRHARITEAEAILILVKESMASYCVDSHIDKTQIEATFETKETIEAAISDGVVFVAVNAKEDIIGTARLYITYAKSFVDSETAEKLGMTARVGYFARFSVWDSMRGKGIGQDLLLYSEDIARRAHCSHVLLHTAIANERMVSFYQTRGYDILLREKSRGYERGLFGKKI